ncbi:MAG: hypothetical protein M3O67_07435 [Bacteroidota bacterium]|nr:hypothetical protein [Bacteroidota bacterium]
MSAKVTLAFKCLIIVLSTFSIISLINKPSTEDYKKNHGHPWEEYDPSFFFKYQRIDDIIADADQHFKTSEKKTIRYYECIAEVIRKRFYHGYSYYSLAENPIACVAGKFSFGHLSAIVIPDDIMKHPMAACSQQAIVLMEIFKKNGVNYREVGFSHHFTTEAMIEGKWRYFDTDMEPNFQHRRASLNELLLTKRFDKVYSYTGMDTADFHRMVENPYYGKINATPAPRVMLFHKLTFFLTSTYFLFIALLVMIFSTVRFPKRVAYKNPGKQIYSPLHVIATKS